MVKDILISLFLSAIIYFLIEELFYWLSKEGRQIIAEKSKEMNEEARHLIKLAKRQPLFKQIKREIGL